jgi:hypothetical protein
VEREQRRERIADFVGDAGREPAHRRESLRAVEPAARETQFGVDVAQVGHGLLEREGAPLERFAHRVEGGGHLGRLARSLDRQPRLEAALTECARGGGRR